MTSSARSDLPPLELIDDEASIAPRALLQRFRGPGLLLAQNGDVLAKNDAGDDLMTLLAASSGQPLDQISETANAFLNVGRTGTPLSKRIVVPAKAADEGNLTYDITALPVDISNGTGTSILLLARNVSLEGNLVEALVSSRALYRDLADCSGDFVWEVDASSRFSFVSPQGIVGYLPLALNGASPAGLAMDPHEAGHLVALFGAREPITETEVWIRGEDGNAACLIASVRPLTDDRGEWCGARGVARDVTADRRRARELDEQRDDDALISAIARAIQQEMQPRDMLRAAARVLVTSFQAAAAWILPLQADGSPLKPAARHVDSTMATDLPDPDFANLIDTAIPSDEQAQPYQIWREGPFLCLLTHHWDVVNGLVVLLDTAGRAEAMLAHAADHLSNAIEHARQLRELDRLSRTDELTGLLNRRAFIAGVSESLAMHTGEDAAGNLMFIDMDNFKAVNDTYGHPVGDALLISLSSLMGDAIADLPSGDHLAARLGGDEFAVWIGACGEAPGALAALTAERLVRAFNLIAAEYGEEVLPGLSIGIASANPDEKLQSLMARADQTLYQVKRSGKGTWKMASEDKGMSFEETGRSTGDMQTVGKLSEGAS
ncbi:MAG: sensor domain-containing diguanylate cyclase [Rhodobiaceae bacterium]|nr:sensor domain-containing diguanylate cyclase [Rhodobiaceae bacterium]